MSEKRLPDISGALIEWYEHHARSLPWRDEPTPYRVWVSEIMLQQTRVDTVKPYFERFLRELPTVEALAEADEQLLLKLWEGLGYYSRVRNMKQAAGEVMARHGGKLPSGYEELRQLKGIGPYTAGAISSIAFGRRHAAVDGNVLRVVARITADSRDMASPMVKTEVQKQVESILPQQRTGDFNQALMELGATVCLPNGEPRCDNCPVRRYCEAYDLDIASQLPLKSPKKERRIEERTVFVILREGRAAIRKRPEKGLLSGLWELPNEEGYLTEKQGVNFLQSIGIFVPGITVHATHASAIHPLQEAKHVFTHVEWRMKGWLIMAAENVGAVSAGVNKTANQAGTDLTWVTVKELESGYPLPTAFKAYIEVLKRVLG